MLGTLNAGNGAYHAKVLYLLTDVQRVKNLVGNCLSCAFFLHALSFVSAYRWLRWYLERFRQTGHFHSNHKLSWAWIRISWCDIAIKQILIWISKHFVVSYGSGRAGILGGLKRIILMGPSHCVAFSSHFWATFIPILNTQWRRMWKSKLCWKINIFKFWNRHLSCGDDFFPSLPRGQNVLLTKSQSKQVDFPFAQTQTQRLVLKTSFLLSSTNPHTHTSRIFSLCFD